MGLFDFLKQNRQEDDRLTLESSSNTKNVTKEKYLGDLSKTKIIRVLCDVPRTDRDETWKQQFLENISTASFRYGIFQDITRLFVCRRMNILNLCEAGRISLASFGRFYPRPFEYIADYKS